MPNAVPESFDLVVIGGGPAGTCGANTAALFGHRVALVEKEPDIGGAGLNLGTVPSKTLRETALALSGWRSRRLFGVDLSLRREATVGDFMHHKDAVSAAERHRVESRMRTLHVERFGAGPVLRIRTLFASLATTEAKRICTRTEFLSPPVPRHCARRNSLRG
jgi:NAD(P) transhydrogenase